MLAGRVSRVGPDIIQCAWGPTPKRSRSRLRASLKLRAAHGWLEAAPACSRCGAHRHRPLAL